ncbi:MAG: hypothetical protein PHG97_04970 [Candidatus Margulisbacteria bacterium]|nr:hypothetical protein [Candidatus Margulisiibacteriota bacterium]
MLTFVDAQNFKVSQMGLGLREYLPGDIVHIVIEAPPDTNHIKAVMPNGEEINLNFDGRSNVWNGYWEVPAGVKKGIYTAKLIANDVEGVTFQGDSSAFYIGEPILALMMKIAETEEASMAKLTEKERIARQRAIESARLALAARRRVALTEGAVTEEAAIPVRPPVKIAAKKIPVKPAAKKKPFKLAAKKVKIKKFARAGEDINVTKARLIVAARSYMAKFEYQKAKSELKALLKIEPDNREIKTMINRLEAVIRAKGNHL